MAQNVVINGVTYQNVPEVDIPKSGSGTAKFYDTSSGDATSSHILTGKKAFNSSGEVSGGMANNGSTSGTISTKAGTYTIPAGYHSGLGSVSISTTEQNKIISTNIKSGIEILGVTGSYSGEAITAGAVSVTPYLTSQTILPSSISKDYISQVNVAAIAITESDNAAGGKTVTIGTVAP